MTLLQKRQELPVFGDVMTNLFEDHFFKPNFRPKTVNSPSVNIFENGEGYTIQLATPGLSKEDFKIDLKNNLLIISAEKKSTEENNEGKTKDKYTLKEFNFNTFKRSFKLPKNADLSKVNANYINGILDVVITKKEKEEELVKQIEVS